MKFEATLKLFRFYPIYYNFYNSRKNFLFTSDEIFRLEHMSFPAASVSFLSLSLHLGTLHFYRFARKSASLTSQRGVELYALVIASAATSRILMKILSERSATEETAYRSAMLEPLSSGRMIDTR